MWIFPRQCFSVNSKRNTHNAFHLFTSCCVSSFPTTGSRGAFWHGLQRVACCHEFLKLLDENVLSTKTKCLFPCFFLLFFCTGGFKDRRGHQWQQATFLQFFKVLSNVKMTWINYCLLIMIGQCVRRCCCLRWCVVGRENSKLLRRIYSAAGGNGSTGEHMFFCVNLHSWYWRAFYKHSFSFSARYQKDSRSKWRM